MVGVPFKHIVVSPFLQQVFDGLLLSDGCIASPKDTPMTARFQIRQCDKNKGWLLSLKKIFDNFDLRNTLKEEMMNVVFPQGTSGIFKSYYLRTWAYVEFREMRNRWYPNGKKIVPRDIVLSPIVLVNWFMGDGCLDIRYKKTCNHYRIIFCTECFSEADNVFLMEQLNKAYGYNPVINRIRDLPRITLGREKDVKDFLFRTFPFHSDCFSYKWRALFDDSYMQETGLVKTCVVCGKEFKANRFNTQQNCCLNPVCVRIKNKLAMRRLRDSGVKY